MEQAKSQSTKIERSMAEGQEAVIGERMRMGEDVLKEARAGQQVMKPMDREVLGSLHFWQTIADGLKRDGHPLASEADRIYEILMQTKKISPEVVDRFFTDINLPKEEKRQAA